MPSWIMSELGPLCALSMWGYHEKSAAWSPEDGSHQDMGIQEPWSGTPSLPNGEKYIFAIYKPCSLWSFVRAAWTKTEIGTHKWGCSCNKCLNKWEWLWNWVMGRSWENSEVCARKSLHCHEQSYKVDSGGNAQREEESCRDTSFLENLQVIWTEYWQICGQ